MESAEDVAAALKSKCLRPVRDKGNESIFGGALVTLHGLEHRSRRQLEAQLFAASSLRHYEHSVLESALDDALADAAAHPDADGLVRVDLAEFLHRLILRISVAMIGLDEQSPEGFDELTELLEVFTRAHEIEWTTADHAAVLAEAAQGQQQFWRGFLEPALARRREPAVEGELPRDLLAVLASSPTIDETVILRECSLYLIASVFTTTTTILNTCKLLHEWLQSHFEDRRRALDEEDTFLPKFVDESLRLQLPITPILGREAESGCHLPSGLTIGAGANVIIDVEAAHHDELVFGQDAQVFNPTRQPRARVRQHYFAFGDGPHVCIGLPLVVGSAAAGTRGDAVVILRALLRAGVTPDPEDVPAYAPSRRSRYERFPVVLRKL